MDLRSAYHQVPIQEEDRGYTAFGACDRLYQFKHTPFGVKNGVAAFQSLIDDIIRTENLKDTFAYMDNVTICRNNQQEHDENLRKFMAVAEKPWRNVHVETDASEKAVDATLTQSDRPVTLFSRLLPDTQRCLSSIEKEDQAIIESVRTCAEIKPKLNQNQSIFNKATSPFERLNVDFKGPLPSSTRNHYLLVVIDEFSRFPFAIPCQDTLSATVIEKLREIFTVFDTPAYMHTNRGTSFISRELKEFSFKQNIATNHSTLHNPRGNGQAERYVGIIWKTIKLTLKSRAFSISCSEQVIDDAPHLIRSLLCTAINCTPHEQMFKHPCHSGNGQSASTWLLQPGSEFLRRYNRSSKYDTIVDERPGTSLYANEELPPQAEQVALSTLAAEPAHDVKIGSEEMSLQVEQEALPVPADQNYGENFDNTTQRTRYSSGYTADVNCPGSDRRDLECRKVTTETRMLYCAIYNCDFLITLYITELIFEITLPLSKCLQTVDLDLNLAVS
ncbi:hypothetical protein PR048_017301 [Dryococelus australis]|uniref:Integrase catalytic domain-containing protein n=1 Tax=Dryococelus australis TaxID=614101 RepID=A0ABQ9H948_9NEOP|nr:hypothetical protein PR048_017301 [Dryococelus australis]